MSVEIECPSGMRLQIRGLKGKEGRLLSDRNAVRQGTVMDSLLTACTEQVLDAGPYILREDGKIDWGKVLIGDRFFTLLQIRLASFGPEYSFKVQCRDNMCRERFDYQLNLETDLTVRSMSSEDREVFKEQGSFKTTLNDGKVVNYRLATGADERKVARNRTLDSALIDMLMMRIDSIEGVGQGTASDAVAGKTVKTIRAYLEDLDWSELVSLLNALDSHDCGIDPQIEIQCPACGGVQEVQLPFERGFFLPTETASRPTSIR
jgi:hypothetical protein